MGTTRKITRACLKKNRFLRCEALLHRHTVSFFMAKNTAKKSAPGIKLGRLVKDSITGFTGIAIGRTDLGSDVFTFASKLRD